jgi:two-component system chemotaxis response regulator CheB
LARSRIHNRNSPRVSHPAGAHAAAAHPVAAHPAAAHPAAAHPAAAHPAAAHPASSPRLVVIAASAGGLLALTELLSRLPADFPAAVAVVQHRGDEAPERLVELLSSATRLKVRHAHDGVVLEPGAVYICPPGMHMTTEHCARLVAGPKVRYVRPNADLMFESAARSYAARALGVVLSGCGSDAALGSLAIAQAGGVVLAQDENTCSFSGMPRNVLKTGAVDQVLAPAELADALQRWVVGRSATALLDVAQPSAAGGKAIKILLVDDHRIVLDGLRVLLEGEPDVVVVGCAEHGEAAIRMASELAPDVVVMDIRMPGLNGVEATRQILVNLPSTKVLALTAESDPRSLDGIFRAGATGCLTKHRAFGELVQAIRSIVDGKVYLSRDIAHLVVRGAISPPRSGRLAPI